MSAQRRALLQKKQNQAEETFEQLEQTLKKIHSKFPGSYDRVEKLVADYDPHAQANGKLKIPPKKSKLALRKSANVHRSSMSGVAGRVQQLSVDGSALANTKRKQNRPHGHAAMNFFTGRENKIQETRGPDSFPAEIQPPSEIKVFTVQCSKEEPDAFQRCICGHATRQCDHPWYKRIYEITDTAVTQGNADKRKTAMKMKAAPQNRTKTQDTNAKKPYSGCSSLAKQSYGQRCDEVEDDEEFPYIPKPEPLG
ncbi:hypothetical protein B0J12DRAFT_692697 [Macrophomina phaseolina]|uniref:Zinc finger SWIM-type protein n=1 Tax=Macrophomina phaseolina TaxID=35725 RepID=A0ABQ8FP96_9PEZI|nr:hypothetical protein B0J12DRAFT_692697 [Macrophomina phaseolina]